jgi:transcriptional regulator with XRE-family HTH domain
MGRATTQPATKTFGEAVAEDINADESFHQEWERLAVARAVASKVIGYRADNALSQRDLAARLGVPQPQIVRLESGDYDPSDETLALLSSKLDMTFTKIFAPASREKELRREGERAEEDRRATVATYRKRNSIALFTAS